MPEQTKDALFEFLLRTGDNCLILSHRLSEWCGHGPTLEEDIALANTALDLLGQARMWLALAGQVEGKGRSEDDLAMLRDVWDFRNVLLVEQPNGDFAQTLIRQFFFDQFHILLLNELCASSNQEIAGIAHKAVKEATYHADRSGELVIALGDGTAESKARMQKALELLYPYIGELCAIDEVDRVLSQLSIGPDLESIKAEFNRNISQILKTAKLAIPEKNFAHKGGKTGVRHSEHLGHLLTQMQWMQRAYPGASW